MKLAIIIVNYNTKEILSDCIQNLFRLNVKDTKIIVVDNDSKDGSADIVEAQFKGVELIKTENNGLAAGYNLGLSRARDCEYCLFMGTDAFPQIGCIEGVVKFLETNQTVGVATAKMILRNGALDKDAHRGFPTPWTALCYFSRLDQYFPKSRIFNNYFLGWKDMEIPHEIDCCISHFMMVKKEVFEKIGIWDEDFFVFGEDVDFCWRVKQAGYQIYYLPQYACLHYKGVSIGTRKESADITKADSTTKLRMKAETTRAMKLFYQKHMYKKYPWIVNKCIEFGISLLRKVRASN